VQFDHRLLATLSLLTCLTALAAGLRMRVGGAVHSALLAVGAAVVLQYMLGVATLLLVVPVDLATLHQANAVLLLSALVTALHVTRPAPGYVR
jgi:heme a synthase